MVNTVVTIENTEMQIKEYKGQRLITFKDIDEVHKRPSGTAKRNFNKNKKRFIENEDYIVVSSDEIRTSHLFVISDNDFMDKVLLTEQGYLMLVKSFRDDLSWAVQRQLVNTYFRGTQPTENSLVQVSNEHRYQTSSTPIPKNTTWYARNQRKMEIICEATHKSKSYLAHRIMMRVGEEYNMDAAKEIYEKELGFPPKYPYDLINYFPELAEIATEYINKLVQAIYAQDEEQ